MEEPFFTAEQFSLLWYSSWQPLVTGSYAFYKGHYDFAALSYLVLLTSLNHWRFPVMNSWRRYLDVACVQLGLWYHVIAAYFMTNSLPYYMFMGLGSISYAAGADAYERGHWWPAALFHMGVHLFGNIGHLILYSSDSSPPEPGWLE